MTMVTVELSSNTINRSSGPALKYGHCQETETEDVSGLNNKTGIESQLTYEVASCLQHGAPTDLQNASSQWFAAVPAISEVSIGLASYLTRSFSEIFEVVLRELRANSLDSAGPSNVINFYHSRSTQSSEEADWGISTSLSTGNNPTLSLSENSISNALLLGRAKFIINLTGSALIEFGQNFLQFPPIFWQGFLLPFFGFRFAWRVAFSCMRCWHIRVRQTHDRVRRLVTRIQTTLRGSGDDIGWLQCIPGLVPVEDRTDRFVQLLGLVSNGVHKLPNSLIYLLVPGLFSNLGPLYFVDTKKYFSKLGLACHIAKIHSEAAVETNALEIKNYIEELYWGSGKQVMLLGHSKGGVDASAAIAMYWSDLKDKVAGLVSVQSPYGGSPIASDILREGQIADLETRRVMELLICKVIKGDIRSLEDLTYDKRREFLSRYPLPPDFPTVSFHTEARIAPGVLSTMSHIAHAELPWPSVPTPSATSEEPAATAKLPVIIPLAAAMAVCALHLQLRYGEKSDGMVVRKDAEIPGSAVVRPDRKFDHAWMVYSPARKEAKEPDSSQMCEALLTLLLEVIKKSSESSIYERNATN